MGPRTRKVVFPLKADYYIVYATTEESVAFVNRLSRYFKEAMEKRKDQDDMDSIMTRVRRNMALQYNVDVTLKVGEFWDIQGIPDCNNRLTKTLRFITPMEVVQRTRRA